MPKEKSPISVPKYHCFNDPCQEVHQESYAHIESPNGLGVVCIHMLIHNNNNKEREPRNQPRIILYKFYFFSWMIKTPLYCIAHKVARYPKAIYGETIKYTDL